MTNLDKVMLSTNDEKYDFPALTTLLYRVCDGDHDKFEEATRLIELFMKAAVKASEK